MICSDYLQPMRVSDEADRMATRGTVRFEAAYKGCKNSRLTYLEAALLLVVCTAHFGVMSVNMTKIRLLIDSSLAMKIDYISNE